MMYFDLDTLFPKNEYYILCNFMFQETLISACCNSMERQRNVHKSSNILELHSRVTKGKTKNMSSESAMQLQ